MNERIVWCLISLWTAIVAVSLAWSWRQVDISVFELARVAAQSHFEKDLVYRRWVAMHGGVYVPPTAETPPNPYLSYFEERDVITTSGKRLTLINPAYMTRQVHELGAERSGVQGHITSLKPIRPENAPDAWERQALQSFERGVEEKVSLETFGGSTYLRFMRPLIMESSCLKCHEAQGYRRGDIRGGISVSVPFAPFLEIERHQHRSLLLGHGVIGVLGVFGLWIGGRRLQQSRGRLLRSLQEAGRLATRDRLLLSSLGEGVYGTDRDGVCIFINPAALALLGYSEEEVIGANQHRLFHARRPDGSVYPSEECPVFQTLRDGQRREIEDAFINKDGQSFPISLLVTPILEQEIIDGAIVSFRDISERRRAEQALTRSSEELRQAQAMAHVGSWRLDIVANELSGSEEAYRIFGVPPYTPLTLDMFIDILHPDDREAVLAAWQAALHGEPYDIEHRIVADGQIKWVRERAEIRLDAHGCPIEGIGTVQDITQQRNTTDRLQTLLDTASDGIHILDEDGNVVEFSQSFSRMLGYAAEETALLNVTDWDAMIPREKLVERLCEFIRAPATFETKHRRKDGSIFDAEINAKGIELGGRSYLYASSRDISERKRIEADLREIRNRLSVVVNTIPDLIWLKDIEGTYLACNREFEAFFGARENKIVGKTDYDFVPKPLADFFRENDRAALESGEVHINEEEVVYRSDGRRAFLETRKVPVADADGRILGVLGIGRDITERKQAEQRAIEANQQLRSALNRLELATKAADIGIWYWDLADNTLTWDERLYGMYAVPDEIRASGLSYEFWQSRCHPDDLPRVEQELAAAVAGDRAFDSAFRILLPDQTVRHIQAAAIVERDESGRAVRMVGINRDITEPKQAEEKIAGLASIVESSSDAIISEDLDGTILTWNRAAEQLFGYTSDEAVGRSITMLIPEERGSEEQTLLAQVRRGEAVPQYETLRRPRGGSDIPVAVTLSPIVDAQDRIVGASKIVRDITERKQAESALQAAKEAADSASRAKSEFIANMSHEIRTPMNAIIGLSGLGLGLPGLSTRLREYLSKIQSSSKALLFIINDILDFSKIEAGRLELDSATFNLEDVLHNVADLFSIGAEQKGVELVFELAPDVPQHLQGDPLRLGQIMNNLVGNAVKFTEAGEVHVKVSCLSSTSSGGEESAKLSFAVRDTGIGISLEQQEHLFKAFQQADGSVTRRFGGTGLGLTISKHLVQRMGGELTLDSELGQGSCFSFVLDLPVAGPPLANRTHAGLHGTHVLVVDDLDTSREMLREILLSWHFKVAEAASGREALERLMQASESPDQAFDLVLLDWMMPQMDGVTVARRVRELVAAGVLPKAPVVMMITAYSRDQLLREIHELPLATILTKPVTPSRLFDAIMDARGGSTQSEPAVETEVGLSERAAPIRGAHVLLVEDNDINQTVARDMLERMGLVVTTAWNGKQALDCLDEGAFDAVLMDLHMPEMDGLEASRRIRVQHRFDRLPIIAMTAAVFEEDRATCEAVGMNAHVAKPIDPQDLLDTLLQWIEPRTEADRLESPRLPAAPDLSVPDLGMSGIDSRQALQRLGGNLNLFHSLLRLLAEEQGDAVEMARAALAAGRRDQAASRLHTLRGVLGNIGAQEAADLALTLERDLKSGTDTGIAEELQRLDRMLQGLFAVVGNYLSGVDEACPRDGDGVPFDLDTDAIATLLQALKEWDLAAVEQFDALYPAIRARLGVDQAQHLRTAMDCLEFSKVEKILADIETQS
ncbi:MAG: PAS domain S-box protein [Gammaproteobacteria bacterium]|nr:PAS domain S-box protein [Gammaproteobacteria bacterium]HRX71724.1 PAS domain S-box protein [Candidatus Competibacteraceae bacterium]